MVCATVPLRRPFRKSRRDRPKWRSMFWGRCHSAYSAITSPASA
jgi:hypothetical protein